MNRNKSTQIDEKCGWETLPSKKMLIGPKWSKIVIRNNRKMLSLSLFFPHVYDNKHKRFFFSVLNKFLLSLDRYSSRNLLSA